MKSEKISFMMIAMLAVLGVSLLLAAHASAQTEVILHHFGGSKLDGTYPSSGVIFDAAGNLYGETRTGGSMNGGTVFELLPEAGGGYMEEIVHNFEDRGVGGDFPHSGLIFDDIGNLYGTTGNSGYGYYSEGKLFELTPKLGGGWMERLVYSFDLDPAAAYPEGVVLDAEGNFFGPAEVDRLGSGAVFELTPSTGGDWSATVLHSFNRYFTSPNAGLTFDSVGHFYGTTRGGGFHGNGSGMVFEFGRTSDGEWTDFSEIHRFNSGGTDGTTPAAGVTIDSSANLYGTTEFGGAFGGGTLYELAPAAGGTWTERILCNFAIGTNSTNGSYPNSTLVFDASGNLYGTTGGGGAYGYGTVFELSPAAGGEWMETVVHSFDNNRMDGTGTVGPLVLDSAGNIYGTTEGGGRYGSGVVFEIVR
jgi:uncharacterized repeat protein (TIGR03803 family)